MKKKSTTPGERPLDARRAKQSFPWSPVQVSEALKIPSGETQLQKNIHMLNIVGHWSLTGHKGARYSSSGTGYAAFIVNKFWREGPWQLQRKRRLQRKPRPKKLVLKKRPRRRKRNSPLDRPFGRKNGEATVWFSQSRRRSPPFSPFMEQRIPRAVAKRKDRLLEIMWQILR